MSTEQEIKEGAARIKAHFEEANKQQSVQDLINMLNERYITGKPGDKDLLDYRLDAVLADMWFDGYNRGMDWEQTK